MAPFQDIDALSRRLDALELLCGDGLQAQIYSVMKEVAWQRNGSPFGLGTERGSVWLAPNVQKSVGSASFSHQALCDGGSMEQTRDCSGLRAKAAVDQLWETHSNEDVGNGRSCSDQNREMFPACSYLHCQMKKLNQQMTDMADFIHVRNSVA